MTPNVGNRGRCLVLAGAVWGLVGCGGGESSTPAPGPTVPTAQALQASQPGEWLAQVKTKLRARRDARLAHPQADLSLLFGVSGVPGVVTSVAGAPPAGAPLADAAAPERSGTTLQEQGVEEDDFIKSDGTHLYTLDVFTPAPAGQDPTQLKVHRRRADGSLEAVSSLRLPLEGDLSSTTQGLLLAEGARRLVVLGALFRAYALGCYGNPAADCVLTAENLPPPGEVSSRVRLDLFDLADPARPSLAQRVLIDGWLVGSRQIGDSLMVVTQHAPLVPYEVLPLTATAAEREAALDSLRSADLLPKVRIGTAPPQPLVTETDCLVQPRNASLGVTVTTVTVFDLRSPTMARTSRCFLGGTEAVYMSTQSLYLATTQYEQPVAVNGLIRYDPRTTTDIHKFAIGPQAIDYRGSGEVEGHLGWDPSLKSYRMSEWNGDLRVLSFTGETGWFMLAAFGGGGAPGTTAAPDPGPPSPATLSVLRERASDRSLQIVGKLPNAQRPALLGKAGEQVHGVRLLGDRGYVVTFRLTDPLYVLDMSDPTDPKTVGELEMPGFSSHLFPLPGGLLLGVGSDASDRGILGGIKVALFDVANPARPRELNSLVIGERGSFTALSGSPHGLNLFIRTGVARIALPMWLLSPPKDTPADGLHRFEVDLQARTLRSRPTIAPAPGAPGDLFNLWTDRSLQIEDHVYYLSRGQMTSARW
ncbi:beta-propeller domain-containing protein [Ideonella sp. A 288]|uniref:beta-propeller domain-containing protein n=1 Tax=Ideonella sp. A 288 TaxID=1962181 RepID=UPI001303A13B|nr:beta-propeller domain-containing protein [Ideonella sp. A 288]